jgi:hypothetical protein
MNRAVVSSYTARTAAFATATGITDTTILGALNTFDLGLISNSLDTKMKAVYPMVGGTSTTCKYNFMDARDLDVAFRLQFFGGLSYSSNGILGNGVNGYADTKLNSRTQLVDSNVHLSFYSRTASILGAYSSEIQAIADYEYSNWIGLRTNNKVAGNCSFTAGYDTASVTASNTLNGFIIGSEIASNSRKLYRNGSVIGSNTSIDNSVLLPNFNLALFGNGTFSGNECAFASMGSGLTDGQATIFYNLVQTMQTTLSRNV